VGCGSRADDIGPIDFFAAYTAVCISQYTRAVTHRTTPKIAPSFGVHWMDPSNTHIWFLGSTRVTHPNSISIGSAVFARLTNVTNRQTQTHRPRYSACSNRSHLLICVHPPWWSASTAVRWRRNTRCHQQLWW